MHLCNPKMECRWRGKETRRCRNCTCSFQKIQGKSLLWRHEAIPHRRRARVRLSPKGVSVRVMVDRKGREENQMH